MTRRNNKRPVEPAADPARPPGEPEKKAPREHAISFEELMEEDALPEDEAGRYLGLEEVPGQDELLRAGDPDVDPLGNLLSGEELPGASDPTPDQNNVDDIGRAAGIREEDEDLQHGLRTPTELLDERDAHRWELDPRSSGRPTDAQPEPQPASRRRGRRAAGDGR